jgi:high-affinity Fe2+/Pb2+ permease
MYRRVSAKVVLGFVGYFLTSRVAPVIGKSVLGLIAGYLLLLFLTSLPMQFYEAAITLSRWLAVCIFLFGGVFAVHHWVRSAWKEYQTREYHKRYGLEEK